MSKIENIEACFMRCLYEKCQATYLHSLRVSWVAEAFLPLLNLNGTGRLLVMAAKLHDLGKVVIPDHILAHPGAYNEDQRRVMEAHPITGAEIFAALCLPGEFEEVEKGIRHHHEKYDGSGYPYGLKGENIPLIARIIAVADFYTAITENRLYRKAFSGKTAIQMLKEKAETEFDPDIVNLLCKTKTSFF